MKKKNRTQTNSLVVSPSAVSVPESDDAAPAPMPPVSVVTLTDNIYTPELVEAVKRFQQWQGLTDDGVIGPVPANG